MKIAHHILNKEQCPSRPSWAESKIAISGTSRSASTAVITTTL